VFDFRLTTPCEIFFIVELAPFAFLRHPLGIGSRLEIKTNVYEPRPGNRLNNLWAAIAHRGSRGVIA
jgi:hypothetical protein